MVTKHIGPNKEIFLLVAHAWVIGCQCGIVRKEQLKLSKGFLCMIFVVL